MLRSRSHRRLKTDMDDSVCFYLAFQGLDCQSPDWWTGALQKDVWRSWWAGGGFQVAGEAGPRSTQRRLRAWQITTGAFLRAPKHEQHT